MTREEKGVPIAENSLFRILVSPVVSIRMLCVQLTVVNWPNATHSGASVT
jgi:hypothetical protein